MVQFFTNPNDSLMERLQSAFPDAKLVKAWNSVGSSLPRTVMCADSTVCKVGSNASLSRISWSLLVYAVIAYYLRHRSEVDGYLARREQKAEEVRQRIESQQGDLSEIRARLLARRQP